MGWLLGCFKCRRRRPTSNSISHTASCKDGCTVSSTAALLRANSAQVKESSEVERVLLVEGNELKRNSLAHIKSDKRTRSARRPSSEQLLQVEKLEEEIESLNEQLMEEATQAKSLTNEVRHLRNCSALLDSPNAFKKALSALEQALEKGHLEESQPLLYLHSLLSKIESSEEVIETSPEHRDEQRQAKSFSECLDTSSLTTKNNRKSLETAHDNALQIEPDHSQGNIFAPAIVPREPDEQQRIMLKDEQSTCISRPRHSSDVGDINANKTQQISVVKRRSSTTLSFSGFLLFEDVTEERFISEKAAAAEPFSCTEFAVTKIIEKTDLRDENLVEASKSLFAFSTDNSEGHSTLTGQSLFGKISKDFGFSNSDSEDNACSEKPEGNGGFSNLHYRSPRCMWSPQDDNTHELDRVCGSLCTQIDANESSHSRYSEADEVSHLSTGCSNSMDHISSNSLDCEDSDPQHGTDAIYSKVLPQMHVPSVKDKIFAKKNENSDCRNLTDIQAGMWTKSMDKSEYLNQRCVAPVDPEVHGCFNDSEGHMTNESLGKANQGKAIFNPMLSSVNGAPLKVLDKVSSNEDDSLYVTSPCLAQGQFCLRGGEAIVEISSPGTTSIWSPNTQMSPYAVHTLSPQPVDSIQGRPSPSTPVSVNSYESRLHLAKADACKLNFTSLMTPLASNAQAETPSTGHSQGSLSSLGEDRPILGTVAAHWNPSSVSSTQKWWDGKGIPNSTNKYKEDQKVSWHATPFEVRLERALAKQGRVFQKKLFTGAMATEMEVSI